MSLPLLTVLSLLSLVKASPSNGCATCELVPIEGHANAGKSEVKKVADDNGCSIQRMTCRANRPDADTYVQFNEGVGGFVKRGDQVVDIKCTNEGQWRFDGGDSNTIVVESLTCLST
uniref:C6 domain-containing protein n=1 Tax=Haemonchus contortus TaxID=6289 RepID=A0A7I4YYZ2_HAECO